VARRGASPLAKATWLRCTAPDSHPLGQQRESEIEKGESRGRRRSLQAPVGRGSGGGRQQPGDGYGTGQHLPVPVLASARERLGRQRDLGIGIPPPRAHGVHGGEDRRSDVKMIKSLLKTEDRGGAKYLTRFGHCHT